MATKKDVPSPKAAKKPVSVDALMRQLKAATDPVEKRKLRMKLRAAGHKGGLGIKPGPKGGNAAVGRKAFEKGKAKRAAKPAEDEVVEE